jgi:hypothetical protein
MSDSSRVQLAGIAESQWGATPSSALTAIRYNTENLGHRKETTRSDEVRSDRQVTDITEVGSNADGGWDFEMSYAAHDIYYQGVFAEDFTADLAFGPVTTIDADDADNSFNDSGSGFGTALVPGQWIYSKGWATGANNGYFEIVSATTAKIVVTGGLLVTEAVGPSISFNASTLVNGVTEKSYTLEKNMSDATQFMAFRGCRMDSLTLNIASRQKVTGTFGVMGKSGALAGATAGSGAYDAAPTNEILNASKNVGKVLEGGAVLGAGIFLQTLEANYNAGLRVVDGVGQSDAVDIGLGRFICNGSLVALFEDEVLFDKYVNSTVSSISVVLTDPAGNTMILSFPAIVYTNGDVVGSGNDNEVVASLEWEAKMHAAQGVMARIDKFAV